MIVVNDFIMIINEKVIELLKKVVDFEFIIESVVEYRLVYRIINYI